MLKVYLPTGPGNIGLLLVPRTKYKYTINFIIIITIIQMLTGEVSHMCNSEPLRTRRLFYIFKQNELEVL